MVDDDDAVTFLIYFSIMSLPGPRTTGDVVGGWPSSLSVGLNTQQEANFAAVAAATRHLVSKYKICIVRVVNNILH